VPGVLRGSSMTVDWILPHAVDPRRVPVGWKRQGSRWVRVVALPQERLRAVLLRRAPRDGAYTVHVDGGRVRLCWGGEVLRDEDVSVLGAGAGMRLARCYMALVDASMARLRELASLECMRQLRITRQEWACLLRMVESSPVLLMRGPAALHRAARWAGHPVVA
jgi:hypothetical protein